MDLIETIFELIDMRSFSNLWFWIVLAVLWSSTSHWVLGVPWDMVQRARRGDEQGVEDLHDMVRINCNRILYIAQETGLLLAGFGCFVLTTLCLLGFVYGNEFSQALFLLGFPMTLVALLATFTAHRIIRDGLTGEALYKRMHHHRIVTQMVGVLSILVTAMWGMLVNMSTGVLGI
ncbi:MULTISPECIES: component of SufBCD complex [unclassified Roseovarius]|uniref:component of SufBCD complex n=1 Tax=unclassified Roseovarius TaxID=2614913 RepID=UPI00273D6721|nr:component of SufBCD complex [Roseovarius sp. MMSF_3350]